jgi:hypothetical protein
VEVVHLVIAASITQLAGGEVAAQEVVDYQFEPMQHLEMLTRTWGHRKSPVLLDIQEI